MIRGAQCTVYQWKILPRIVLEDDIREGLLVEGAGQDDQDQTNNGQHGQSYKENPAVVT